ncbi:tyrosine-type recombinase/integrase [Salmonella enterica subsp. enterica serovar Give]|uniref:tyrosine-type recombinase/integrase n=1 Tax=Salmonella enterica TaxID=28901 RepID=UPI0021B47C19|nr:tyrosine-type recombinase/integrase [Salmonella enterica]MCT7251310.1 tyrosine-type recombinase/integrase [Salmonella enterica subsp. enterica serovar Give]
MKRKYLTQEEIEKLLSATDRMPFPERNRCLILMAFIHGFRASELLGLRLSDIENILRKKRLKNCCQRPTECPSRKETAA